MYPYNFEEQFICPSPPLHLKIVCQKLWASRILHTKIIDREVLLCGKFEAIKNQLSSLKSKFLKKKKV